MQEIQFANTASIRMSAEPSILMTRSFSKMLLPRAAVAAT
jgi:hypothetical protein